jgi:streptogramin lyase
MGRRVLCLLLLALVVGTSASARPETASVRIGGRPLQLLAAQGSLWVLTCDRRCSGEGKRSTGRIVRIDARRGRVVGSAMLERPGTLAVSASGVFVTDFWRDAVRRLDPETLRTTATLHLVLPHEVAPGDRDFLPNEVAAAGDGVWVATARGALVHADSRLRRVFATVRLTQATTGPIALGSDAVWVGEALLGVYRVDRRRHRVAARIRISHKGIGRSANRLFVGGGKLFVFAGRSGSYENVLARIDPGRNRVEAVTPLPPDPLVATFGMGSLWVGRFGGSHVLRIDARTTAVSRHRGRVGVALAVAGGRLWTATRNGLIRPVR